MGYRAPGEEGVELAKGIGNDALWRFQSLRRNAVYGSDHPA